jgi:hypothetical protein
LTAVNLPDCNLPNEDRQPGEPDTDQIASLPLVRTFLRCLRWRRIAAQSCAPRISGHAQQDSIVDPYQTQQKLRDGTVCPQMRRDLP